MGRPLFGRLRLWTLAGTFPVPYFQGFLEYVLTLLNSVFKGSRADVGADVGLVPGRRGCGRGFRVLGAIQKIRVEGFTRVRFLRPPSCFAFLIR